MGGFMINGCGTADSYYQLKFLETRQCKFCKKERAFSLMELKMKIRVLFIPTVSIGTKYAIVCEKCKNGYYIETAQKDGILNGTLIPEITDECINFKELNDAPGADKKTETTYVPEEPKPIENGSAEAKPEEVNAPETQNDEATLSNPLPAPAEDSDVNPFISYNISSVEKDDSVEPDEIAEDVAETESKPAEESVVINRTVKVCPECKLLFSGKEVCPVCGETLVERN